MLVCAVTEAEADELSQTVETAADDDELSEQESTADSSAGVEMTPLGASPSGRYEPFQQTPMPARYKALGDAKNTTDAFDAAIEAHEEKGLSGAQDAAIAGELLLLLPPVVAATVKLDSGIAAAVGSPALLCRRHRHCYCCCRRSRRPLLLPMPL